MTGYFITFIIMVGVFMVGCFKFKLPVGVSMMIAALCGAIEGGLGTESIRMMVEGEFGYVDTILTIGSAMIFMKVIEDSGALDAMSSLIIEKFHKVPAILLILIMLIIMFPGMITGSSTAAVLSSGSIMAPILALMGIDAVTAGSIIAMGALLGMIAPPVNTAALIICAGIDVPYVGFTGPLALITFPLAILFVLLLGYKQAKQLDYEKLKPALVKQDETRKQYGIKIYIPLMVLLALMIIFKILRLGEDIGMPLIYGLAPLLVLFCCEILVSGLALKSLRLRRLLYGLPSMIIEKGKIAQREMQKNRFTPDELAQELRIQGIMDISSVEYAILETNGQLNIILYPAEQPVTAKQMQVDVPDGGFFSIVISDGRVLTDNLTRLGLDRRWLEKELRRRGADGPKRVYLMMVNDDGEIYYAAKEQRA